MWVVARVVLVDTLTFYLLLKQPHNISLVNFPWQGFFWCSLTPCCVAGPLSPVGLRSTTMSTLFSPALWWNLSANPLDYYYLLLLLVVTLLWYNYYYCITRLYLGCDHIIWSLGATWSRPFMDLAWSMYQTLVDARYSLCTTSRYPLYVSITTSSLLLFGVVALFDLGGWVLAEWHYSHMKNHLKAIYWCLRRQVELTWHKPRLYFDADWFFVTSFFPISVWFFLFDSSFSIIPIDWILSFFCFIWLINWFDSSFIWLINWFDFSLIWFFFYLILLLSLFFIRYYSYWF